MLMTFDDVIRGKERNICAILSGQKKGNLNPMPRQCQQQRSHGLRIPRSCAAFQSGDDFTQLTVPVSLIRPALNVAENLCPRRPLRSLLGQNFVGFIMHAQVASWKATLRPQKLAVWKRPLVCCSEFVPEFVL